MNKKSATTVKGLPAVILVLPWFVGVFVIVKATITALF